MKPHATRSSRRQLLPYPKRTRRDVLSQGLLTTGVLMELGAVGTTMLGFFTIWKRQALFSSPSSEPVRPHVTVPPLNQAVAFRNPRTHQHDVLVHLPSGLLVAYDQHCTHSGVLVTYDPLTHHLVCPAHGAIFDPAAAGKVLEGPATQALPALAIRVEADGTITGL